MTKQVVKYRIYLNGNLWIEFSNNGSNRQSIQGLTPNTCYDATVRAGDQEGLWSEDRYLEIFVH